MCVSCAPDPCGVSCATCALYVSSTSYLRVLGRARDLPTRRSKSSELSGPFGCLGTAHGPAEHLAAAIPTYIYNRMLACWVGAAASSSALLLPAAPTPTPKVTVLTNKDFVVPAPQPVGPRRKAVERILNVELARLTTAIELNFARFSLPEKLRAKAPTTQEIADEMDARQPIIRWALNLWVKDAMGFDQFGAWCPTLRRMRMHPWQWEWPAAAGPASLKPPTLVQALRALRPSLEVEIRRGLRTSPLRVTRLAWRAILVYLLAALSFLPGPTQPLIQRTWPRIVEHLATTLETNHRLALEGTETAGTVYLGATAVGSAAEAAPSPTTAALLAESPRRQLGSRVEHALGWVDGPLASVQLWLRSRWSQSSSSSDGALAAPA